MSWHPPYCRDSCPGTPSPAGTHVLALPYVFNLLLHLKLVVFLFCPSISSVVLGDNLFASGSAAEAFASSRITIDKLICALMSACSALITNDYDLSTDTSSSLWDTSASTLGTQALKHRGFFFLSVPPATHALHKAHVGVLLAPSLVNSSGSSKPCRRGGSAFVEVLAVADSRTDLQQSSCHDILQRAHVFAGTSALHASHV